MRSDHMILLVRALGVRFGSLRAVHDVSFDAQRGHITSVIGPNGAGKSTLFNLISGAIRPGAGQVLFGGRDMTGAPPHRMLAAGLARSFQITNLFAELSVRENLRLASQFLEHGRGLLRPLAASRAANARVDELIAQFSLAAKADEQVGTLSHGEQRRLEIATALASRPQLLLLDEPTQGMSHGDTREVILVLAQTDTGARGIARFLVDMPSQGVTRLPPHKTSVGTLLGAGGVVLQDCFVRDENVIHLPGEAFRIAMKAIVGARIHVAVMCVAMLEAGLARAVAYCSKRHTFGQPLLAHQGLRWQLADVATELEAALQLVVRGADLVEADRDATLIAAHAKKFCVHAAERGLLACVQAIGAQGVLDEHGLMRQLAEAKLAAYADGTTEMQTERIGQLLVDRYAAGL